MDKMTNLQDIAKIAMKSMVTTINKAEKTGNDDEYCSFLPFENCIYLAQIIFKSDEINASELKHRIKINAETYVEELLRWKRGNTARELLLELENIK